jgi:hypothetical protein
MRILKHIIFISILSGVFVLIYRQSDEKGFHRWWISFKLAVLTAAIAAGLIPFNTEVIESPGNNNQFYQERLLSDQEFNLFEDSDQRVIFAKNSGEAEAFPVTPINKSGQNRNGLFGTGNEKGNPDDDPSNSNTPFSDFKENRAESKNYEHQIYRKMSDKDANSETDDESECYIDEVKTVVANDGTFIHAEKSQVRDKGLHIPDFLDAETLDGKFDVIEAEKLKYLDRLKYLRDENNLPDEIVITARDKILDFMTADDTKLVPGYLGYSKIEGTVFINLRLNKVGFRDNNGYRFRTAMTMGDDKILKLAKTDIHLFPDAGKPKN